MLHCAPTSRYERPVCRKPMALEASSSVQCLLAKQTFLYRCLTKFTVCRPLLKLQKINISTL